jgi:fibronectin type 3 domain-containing protein
VRLKYGIIPFILLLLAIAVWPQNQHYIQVTWNAYTQGTDAATNINVYRSSIAGGPYTKLSSVPVSSVSYNDTTCPITTVCYYVMTAVDASGFESSYSTEVSATMPVGPLGLAGVKAVAK